MDKSGLLQQAVGQLNGVGAQTAKRLNKLGIFRVQDLLFHLPLRYEDRTSVHDLDTIKLGDNVLICGVIAGVEVQVRRRNMLVCQVKNGNSLLLLRFFNFTAQQRQHLEKGHYISAFGEVKAGYAGLEIIHPEYKILSNISEVVTEPYLTPIYPTTDGLKQGVIRRAVQQALAYFKATENNLPDWLPASLLGYPSLAEAINTLHTPQNKICSVAMQERTLPAIKRLALEELLAQHLCLLQIKHKAQTANAPIFKDNPHISEQLRSSLPFKLTQAQQCVIAEITKDCLKPSPMMRLLQGDVGCGKTVVCAFIALLATGTQYQVAVMAPTELLAEQHYANFKAWLNPLSIQVDYLSGSLKNKARKHVLQAIATTQSQIIVGTHALFQEQVEFARLGLVIIDEQHRFGVHQRLALKNKGYDTNFKPHQLMMTATPIPRTLAMLQYSDLDISIINQLPPGRIPAITRIISAQKRQQIIDRIKDWNERKRQTYWVCTLIEESKLLQCQATEKTLETLTKKLPNVRIGLVHGRMTSTEKNQIMQEFKQHKIDLLVATTVIEVGVDVANAGLMIIENAERLGLAQLHQLRGRVGRGNTASYCLLMYQPPLSDHARERLSILRKTNNGFTIAEHDLQLRGSGEVLGTRQTGALQFKVADLSKHADLVAQIPKIAHTICDQKPEIVQEIIDRWLTKPTDYSEI